MIETLLVLSLATMVTWEFLRYITPVEIPVRLAPVLVFMLALGWTAGLAPPHVILMAAGAAGGVAVLHAVTGAAGIEPWEVPKITWKTRTKRTKEHRPPLPPSIGRRIPQL